MSKPTKAQALKKLELLAEQVRKHAEANGLQCFVYYEAPDHKVALTQHCSEELIVNIAAHIGMQHPTAIVRARQIMIEVMGRADTEKVEQEAEKKVVIELHKS